MKYFRLKSLTFWACVAEASINLLRIVGVDIPKEADGIIIAIGGIGMRKAMGDK